MDLTWQDVEERAESLVKEIFKNESRIGSTLYIYPIPNGGIYAGLILQKALLRKRDQPSQLVDSPENCHEGRSIIYVDDIIDSGETRRKFTSQYTVGFYALVNKRKENLLGQWVSFPWERVANKSGPEDNVRRLLEYIGDDPGREGLRETPARVARSYKELFAGYGQKPEDVLKVFEDGACDEMVILKGCEWFSCCEHHMQPFFGKAHIAYIPDKRVIGISKLARILDIYSRRLQIQERIGQQVTKALDDHLKPRGSACILEAAHFCMTCRGVQKQHSTMVTSSLTGVFRELPVRQELLSLIRP